MHHMILGTGSVLLKLGLLPLNSTLLLPFCTAAHDSATATATFVLQFPLNMLHHAAHSTSTTDCCTLTVLLRSKQLKIHPKVDMLVSLDAL